MKYLPMVTHHLDLASIPKTTLLLLGNNLFPHHAFLTPWKSSSLGSPCSWAVAMSGI